MKKKVLLITQELTHYRVPLFQKINESYELTVAHGTSEKIKTSFKQQTISFKTIGPFLIINEMPVIDNYDVIILTFNIRILSFYGLLVKKVKPKIILWGIGVSASYKNKYDINKKLDWLRLWWIKKSDGVIFYDNYPKIKFMSKGISSNKLFVAYNTIENNVEFDFSKKKFETFLFIGSLYKAKGIGSLLESYLLLYNKFKEETPSLDIIGDGEQSFEIGKWIADNNLENKIYLHGKITNQTILKTFFNKAIVCISPGQAGLSVLKSFSFGVPFITTENAITGGERFNIINNVNGFLYSDNHSELVNILTKIIDLEIDIKQISENSFYYYQRFRNSNVWMDGFHQALNDVN